MIKQCGLDRIQKILNKSLAFSEFVKNLVQIKIIITFLKSAYDYCTIMVILLMV